MSEFSDYISLIEVLIWPIITLILIWFFRKPIKEFIKKIAPRVSKLSAFGITLELSKTKELKPSWILSDNMDIRRLSPASDFQDSYTMTLMNTITSNYDADYAIIDLDRGESWLTSRLYIFTIVFEMITKIKCLIFVGSDGTNVKQFIGYANLTDIRWSLAGKYPWLEAAFTKAYSNHFGMNLLNENLLLNIEYPYDVSNVVHNYLNNIQQQVLPPDTQNWLNVGMIWEKTQWIDQRQIRLDLGEVLQESYIQDSSGIPEEEMLQVILRQNGDFVALVGENRKFKTLIDRKLLVEKTVKKFVGYS